MGISTRLLAGTVFLAVLSSAAPPYRVAAAEKSSLAGKTLSAVVYVRRGGMPGPSELARFMFQAYLRGDGRALVRVWDTARGAYTRPSEGGWALLEHRLCLDLPAGPRRLCADVHIWGPRIAGIGTSPYVMLDGDLQSGNAIVTAH